MRIINQIILLLFVFIAGCTHSGTSKNDVVEVEKTNLVIAIDGPSCSGKGAVAHMLAEHFNIESIDTGLLYRKITSLNAAERKRKGITTPINPDTVSQKDLSIDVSSLTLADMLDETKPEFSEAIIRSEAISKETSAIAKIPEVREKINEFLRDIVAKSKTKIGYIAEGRDMGTAVFPNAICKIYLTADSKIRARRRFESLKKKGATKITYEEVLKNMEARDKEDSTRKIAPLRADESYVIYDTSTESLEESVAKISEIIIREVKRKGKIDLLNQENEQETLSIIKPDAIHLAEKINAKFQNAGLKIVAQKKVQLTMDQVKEFYKEHREKEFFGGLCEYMCSGPIIVQILRGKDAIAKSRKVMGSTNPQKAEVGTIRREFGTDVRHNATHGSDSKESAAKEIKVFFE